MYLYYGSQQRECNLQRHAIASNLFVERAIAGEAGRMVDLQHPGTEPAVQYHIKPEDLPIHGHWRKT
jgi:hypothetical protein